jgi:hypothetical protein
MRYDVFSQSKRLTFDLGKTMKTLTLRLSYADHASLSAVSSAQRMSMAAFLMSLFDKHVASHQAQHSSAPTTKTNKLAADDLQDLNFPDEE